MSTSVQEGDNNFYVGMSLVFILELVITMREFYTIGKNTKSDISASLVHDED